MIGFLPLSVFHHPFHFCCSSQQQTFVKQYVMWTHGLPFAMLICWVGYNADIIICRSLAKTYLANSPVYTSALRSLALPNPILPLPCLCYWSCCCFCTHPPQKNHAPLFVCTECSKWCTEDGKPWTMKCKWKMCNACSKCSSTSTPGA